MIKFISLPSAIECDFFSSCCVGCMIFKLMSLNMVANIQTGRSVTNFVIPVIS